MTMKNSKWSLITTTYDLKARLKHRNRPKNIELYSNSFFKTFITAKFLNFDSLGSIIWRLFATFHNRCQFSRATKCPKITIQTLFYCPNFEFPFDSTRLDFSTRSFDSTFCHFSWSMSTFRLSKMPQDISANCLLDKKSLNNLILFDFCSIHQLSTVKNKVQSFISCVSFWFYKK